MGNTFETATDGGGKEKTTGKKTASSSEENKRSYYITEDERQYLRHIFQNLHATDSGAVNEAYLRELLLTVTVPFVTDTFCSYFRAKTTFQKYSTLEKFLIESVRTNSSSTLKVLWDLADHIPVARESFDWSRKLLKMSALMLVLSSGEEPANEAELHRAAQELTAFYTLVINKHKSAEEHGEDSLESVQSVINTYSPHSIKPLQCLLSIAFFKAHETPAFKNYVPPTVPVGASSLLDSMSRGFLGMAGEDLQGNWKRLYTMSSDGISFNRIVHHILGYDGPTVLLIETAPTLNPTTGRSNNDGTIFGVYSHDRWKEINRFFGSSKNFLFTLSPHFRIYHPTSASNQHYQYLVSSGFNLPHGMGFGGTMDGFRLFIPDTLEQCTARAICPTYEPGKMVFTGDSGGHGTTNHAAALSNSVQFEIAHLEIWGSGGLARVETGLKAQKEQRQVMAENIDKARKVDKAQFFNNGFDREFLLQNTFSHQREMQERVEDS